MQDHADHEMMRRGPQHEDGGRAYRSNRFDSGPSPMRHLPPLQPCHALTDDEMDDHEDGIADGPRSILSTSHSKRKRKRTVTDHRRSISKAQNMEYDELARPFAVYFVNMIAEALQRDDRVHGRSHTDDDDDDDDDDDEQQQQQSLEDPTSQRNTGSVNAHKAVNPTSSRSHRQKQAHISLNPDVLEDLVILEDNAKRHVRTWTRPSYVPPATTTTQCVCVNQRGEPYHHSNLQDCCCVARHDNARALDDLTAHSSDSCISYADAHRSSDARLPRGTRPAYLPSHSSPSLLQNTWNPKTDPVIGSTSKTKCKWAELTAGDNHDKVDRPPVRRLSSQISLLATTNDDHSTQCAATNRDRPRVRPSTMALRMPRRRASVEQPSIPDAPMRYPRRMSSSSSDDVSIASSEEEDDTRQRPVKMTQARRLTSLERRLPCATNSFLLATKKFKRRGAILHMTQAQILAVALQASEELSDEDSVDDPRQESEQVDDAAKKDTTLPATDAVQTQDHETGSCSEDSIDDVVKLCEQTRISRHKSMPAKTASAKTQQLRRNSAFASPMLPVRQPSLDSMEFLADQEPPAENKNDATETWLRKSTLEQMETLRQALRELDACKVSRRRGAVTASCNSAELSYGGHAREHDRSSDTYATWETSASTVDSHQEQTQVLQALHEIQDELIIHRRGGMAISGSSHEDLLGALNDAAQRDESPESSMELKEIFPSLEKTSRQAKTQHQLQSLAKALRRIASRTVTGKISVHKA